MDLIVENGTGVAGADSYNSIAELDCYMFRYGHDAWPVSSTPCPEPPIEEAPTEPPVEEIPPTEEINPQAEEEIPQPPIDTETPADPPADPPIEETPPDPILLRKQAAARQAARYLDVKYALRLSGEPTVEDQGLAWPRTKAVDFYGSELAPDQVPNAIKQAHAEVSFLVFTNVPLFSETSAGPLLKRKKIEGLEWEYDNSTYGQAPSFGLIDQILLPLFGPAPETGAMDVLAIERA